MHVKAMFSDLWKMLKETVFAFIEDEALSRGAAIAFYAATSIAPLLLIVIAIAGLVFGHEAAHGAITAQLTSLMGQQTADLLQAAAASAANPTSGLFATLVGVGALIATASGVFGEMQSSLNAIWKAEPKGTTVSRLIRARAVSLGLVAALGFLLIVSLAVSAGLTAFGTYLDSILPFGKIILSALNGLASFAIISVMFAAVYTSRMARCGDRCRCHGTFVHDRKNAHWMVHREQRRSLSLRRRRRTPSFSVMGILFCSNIFVGL